MSSLLSTLRQQAPHISPEQFLAYHPGCFIQYYDDTPAKDPAKALSTRLFSPSFAARKQMDKCAVCFSLQAFRDARTKETISGFRNLGVDVDLVPEGRRETIDAAAIDRRKEDYLRQVLWPFPLHPHWVIETQHGFHIIVRVRPHTDAAGIRLGETVNRLLVRTLHGDDHARLLTQVLRVPGFRQFKDPEHPFLCRLLLDKSKTTEPYDLEVAHGIVAAWLVSHGEEKPGIAQQPASLPTGTAGPRKWQAGLSGVAEGQRNDTAASLIGKLLSELPVELWETAGWGGLKEWNQKNRIPLPEKELRTVFDSIVQREQTKRKGRGQTGGTASAAQADKLVTLARSGDTVLFHDQFGEPYGHVRIKGNWRTCRIRGQDFREWLCQRQWDEEQKTCGTDQLHAALNTLAGMARYEGPRISLENRVAWHGGALWYDLADAQGQAVRVTGEGWQVVREPPTLFRRYSHQQPQVCPVRGRPLSALLPLLNLRKPAQSPLLLTYLVSCFLPDIPHPIGLFFGPQGAAKSTTVRLLRRLIDPTALDGLSLSDPRQLPQLLFHHWFAAFDNVSGIAQDVADLLCRAVTGDGFTRRRLYSDEDDIIYHFRRCVCLNGISLVAERPDLLDRCLLFPLDRIADGDRREEREMAIAFDELRPELVGAIFDILAGAIQRYPSLPTLSLPRMADFARWGCAIADALGIGHATFLSLYGENIREQHEVAIEASPVASAVAELMARQQEWSGTATELLKQMQKLVHSGSEDLAGLPRRPNLLTKQLHGVKANLAHVGITLDTDRRSNGNRRIIIRRATMSAAVSPADHQAERASDARTAPATPAPALRSRHPAAVRADRVDSDDEASSEEGEPLLHLPPAKP